METAATEPLIRKSRCQTQNLRILAEDPDHGSSKIISWRLPTVMSTASSSALVEGEDFGCDITPMLQ